MLRPPQMQVTDGGTGRVAGEPTLEDERAAAREGGPGGPPWSRVGVRGGGRRGNRCCLATCPQPDSAPSFPGAVLVAGLQHARGSAGGKDSEGAGVPEVNGDPSL